MASSAPAMVGLTFADLTQTPRESAVRPHRHGAGRRWVSAEPTRTRRTNQPCGPARRAGRFSRVSFHAAAWTMMQAAA